MIDVIKSVINKRAFFYAIISICIGIVSYSFVRDWNLDEVRRPTDLGNRIVGSRLLDKDQSPYIVGYQNADPLRLHDSLHGKPLAITGVTATPFLLWMYSPLSGLKYYDIAKTWLVIEYLCFMMILVLCWRIIKPQVEKSITTLLLCLFTLSDGWQCHTDVGQHYILYALIFTLLFYLLNQGERKPYKDYIAAAFSVVLVLIRPTAAVFLFPLIFLFPQLKRYIISMVVLFAFYVGFTFGSERQLTLWKGYFFSANQHSLINRGIVQPNDFQGYTEPSFQEGYDIEKHQVSTYKPSYRTYNFNYYRLPEEFGFKKFSMNESIIHYCFIAAIGLLALWNVFRKQKSYEIRVEKIFCYGFVMYMLAEIFIPIIRGTYNEIQWLPIIVIVPALMISRKWLMIALAIFMYLSIISVKNFGLQVIFREAFMLGVLYLSLFFTKNLDLKR